MNREALKYSSRTTAYDVTLTMALLSAPLIVGISGLMKEARRGRLRHHKGVKNLMGALYEDD